jgi:hypothetical protein
METADEDVTADALERSFFDRADEHLAQAADGVEDDFEPRAENFFARLKKAAETPRRERERTCRQDPDAPRRKPDAGPRRRSQGPARLRPSRLGERRARRRRRAHQRHPPQDPPAPGRLSRPERCPHAPSQVLAALVGAATLAVYSAAVAQPAPPPPVDCPGDGDHGRPAAQPGLGRALRRTPGPPGADRRGEPGPADRSPSALPKVQLWRSAAARATGSGRSASSG